MKKSNILLSDLYNGGWILKTPDIEYYSVCNSCGNELNQVEKKFYCKDNALIRCQECDKQYTNCDKIGLIREHHHFNIIKIDKIQE